MQGCGDAEEIVLELLERAKSGQEIDKLLFLLKTVKESRLKAIGCLFLAAFVAYVLWISWTRSGDVSFAPYRGLISGPLFIIWFIYHFLKEWNRYKTARKELDYFYAMNSYSE